MLGHITRVNYSKYFFSKTIWHVRFGSGQIPSPVGSVRFGRSVVVPIVGVRTVTRMNYSKYLFSKTVWHVRFGSGQIPSPVGSVRFGHSVVVPIVGVRTADVTKA